MKRGFYLPALLSGYLIFSASICIASDWREDFSKISKQQFKARWQVKKSIGVPVTKFKLQRRGDSGCLTVEADKSSGALITAVKEVDLKRTPIMRWCWRVRRLPKDADGRVKQRDDQAIAVYVGVYRGLLGQDTIAYRWETETPRNVTQSCRYLLGAMRVKWFCLRNRTDKLGEWYIEERDIAADFKKIYGILPKKFALSIAANSQYTQSVTSADIAWIEFVAKKSENLTGKVDNLKNVIR